MALAHNASGRLRPDRRESRLRYWPVLILMAARCACANDLEEFYQLALTRDAVLQAAAFQRQAAIETRPQALSQLLPQLSASAYADREREGYQTQGVISTVVANCGLGAGAGMEYCYGKVHGLGVSLSQALWSYQAFSQLKEANLQTAAAEASYRSAQQNLLLRVADTYFAILSAADQLKTNRSRRDSFSALLKQAQVREQTGVGPRSDVEQAHFFYDATEENLIDAQNALDDANLALAEIVGTQTLDIAPLRDQIPLTSPDPDSIEEWVESARRDNFDVRAALLNVEAAERGIAVQRGRGLPTLALVGSSSRAFQDAALGGNTTFDSVGVAFSWPLFQSGAVASAVRQSRALYRQAQAQYDALQRDTERQTRAAYRGVVSGVQRIGAAQRAVESGRTALEASRRNVEFGTGTEFDLLNAQNNYYAALSAYHQARYDYLTNLLSLKQQAGRLTEHDLEAIDDLLVARGA